MVKRKPDENARESRAPKKSRLVTPSASHQGEAKKHSSQSSSLLSLPPELRNIIYEYVLTADDGLLKLTPQIDPYSRYRQENRLPFRQYHINLCKVLPEFNQLKFVCNLLYKETESRELKYNTLVLEQAARAEMEPDEQLMNFKSLCSPTKFTWIKNIELHIKALAMPGSEILRYFLTDRHLNAYVRAAQFCRQHPELDVKYVLNSFSWSPCFHLGSASQGFINQGIVLLKTLRNIDVSYLHPDPAHAQQLLSYGASLRSRKKKESWYASNLKFHPLRKSLDEEAFRNHAGAGHVNVEGAVEKWIEVAKAWVKDGF